MINTNSLIDGFPCILGSLPVQFAMTIAMLAAIRIPKDDNDEADKVAQKMYYWVLGTHLCILFRHIICQGCSANMHQLKKIVTIACLIIQVLMINVICGEWIFEETTTIDYATASHDMKQFDIWMTLEACLVLSFICINWIYLLIRFWKDPVYNLSTGKEIATEYSDSLEQAAINMQCYESFWVPLMSTLFLKSNLFDFDYNELMKDYPFVNFIVSIFFWLDVCQAVLATGQFFVPVWIRRGHRWYNNHMYKVQYVSIIFLIFVIPISKVLLYIVALFLTDVWVTVISAYLLACCLISLFISAYWYPITIRPEIENAKKNLERERTFEKNRLEGQKQAVSVAQALFTLGGGITTPLINKTPLVKFEDLEQMTGYRNQRREPGQGPLRIGTKLDFREDMYSLLYISLVHPVYKDWCDEEADKKDKELDEVIAKVLNEEQEVEEEDDSE